MGTDTAFLDRVHCYLPGWEIPKFRPEHFTNDYGFISNYLAEFIRELRKEQYSDALDKYFRLGKNLNQRDTIAVRKMVGGYLKLLYPNGQFSKEELEEILRKKIPDKKSWMKDLNGLKVEKKPRDRLGCVKKKELLFMRTMWKNLLEKQRS